MNGQTDKAMSLRQLAKELGVSQPFLSQIRAGKRPLPEHLRESLEAMGAYHLLISDKQSGSVVEGVGWGVTPNFISVPKGQVGDPPRNRTENLRIKSPLLCQLS